MSAVMDSNTRTIYIPLLDEGTPVVRPTQGVLLGNDLFRVLPTPSYNPDDEHWEFPPGSVVRCVTEKKDGEEIVVARGLATVAQQ
jgi:hypothetical protein